MNGDYSFDADLAIADTEIDRLRSENKSLKEDIADLNLALECAKKSNLSRKTQLEDLDRQIQDISDRVNVNCLTVLTSRFESEKSGLKHELNDARLLHLEQLKAIVDMLQPLADNKVGWVNDWSIGALKLAIAVIQNNINELSC